MTQDRYMPGVPCWADTSQPDPQAAAAFYAGLFGWELEEEMPPDSGAHYLAAKLNGGDVAAVSSIQEGAPPMAMWNIYVWVESAEATAAKVRDAGGSVLSEPFDVFEAGRMAVFADAEGAVFCVWEPGRHRGATVVNEPGSVNFHDLHSRDLEKAKAFYGAVFGWTTLELGGPGAMWTLPGYGDFLEELYPGTRARNEEYEAPEGFIDVVGSLQPVEGDAPPHWGVTFAVADADAAAKRAAELGGTVVVPPFSAPWVRMTVLQDPAGATFVASQFVPPEPG
jgi:predicted enzyme related to lactoylglutathione lyase